MKILTDRLLDDIEVVVLTHPSRPSCTLNTLDALEIPHSVFSSVDHNFSSEHPEKKLSRTDRPSIRDYALRQFRAFKGHQRILIESSKPYTLVFEDDMVLAPGVTLRDVLRHVNGATRFIDAGYDAVSFHGRKQSSPTRSLALFDREYVELSRKIQEQPWQLYFLQPVMAAYEGRYTTGHFRWHEGCLAYLAGPMARTKWAIADHGYGMPRDLFLVNELHTLVMRRSLFQHEQMYGSVITDFGRIKPFEE